MLAASRRAKVVMPMSAAAHAHAMGIAYQRMVTTNADLRVEFLDDRIYAVPSAHDQLDWTPLGGYPYLGYLVRFGPYTIYHAGDGVPYDRLAGRLRPYNVTVALLPIGGAKNFKIPEAAQLAQRDRRGVAGAHALRYVPGLRRRGGPLHRAHAGPASGAAV